MSDRYIIQSMDLVSPTTFLLRVARNDLTYKSGQFFSVGIPGSGINREYSVYSGEDEPYLEFLIKRVDQGTVSPLLSKVKPGDALEILGPYSDFVLKDLDKRHIFVCTGTGIAPFHSFIRTFPQLNYKLIHGIRHGNEQYHRDHYAPGRYVSCISRDQGGDFKGRVTQYLAQEKLQTDDIIYLCGNKEMICEAYDLLKSRRIPSDNIVCEAFF